jgi:simple sugar transport system permease protein
VTNHAQPLPTTSWVLRPKAIAVFGSVLGLVAFWSAIPPFTVRSPLVPILIGVLAIAAGLWAVSRGARRVGWGAIVSGVLGLGLGLLATRSSSANLQVVFRADLIAQVLVFATPLTFGALGGMVSERSGVVNVGLEGMMLMGAFWGVYGADKGGSWVVGILTAMLAGGLFALLHAYWSIHLRANQIISGMAINFLALGVTGYFFEQLYGNQNIPSGVSSIPNVKIPGVDHTSFIGPAIGDLNLLIWIGIAFVPLSYFVLFKTPIGLRVRACGEHPRAADTVGINVYAIRYAAVVVSGMLAALGGAFLSIGFLGGSFTENMTEGRGFIALAAMIFGNWRPFGAWGAALLFGFSTALAYRLPVYSSSAATLFQALPYVLTLIAVAGVIGRSVPPAADGQPYVKQ